MADRAVVMGWSAVAGWFPVVSLSMSSGTSFWIVAGRNVGCFRL